MLGRITVAMAASMAIALGGCSSGPRVGTQAPAFAAVDDDGNDASLPAYRGRIVVLDFWATWCKPCREASPYVQQLHERFAGNDGVVVLGVHYDDKGDPAGYMAEHGYTYPVILDGSEVVATYGIRRIPTFLVIDRDGTVIHNQVGFHGPTDVETIAEVVESRL